MTLQLMMWGLAPVALATGLVAGVFLTFSDFVMRSLAASQPAAGAEAMQVINRKVYSSVFMVLLIGLIPVSALIALLAWVFLPGPAAVWLTIAGALYFAGVFLVSVVGNIPMNRVLDAMPDGGEAAQRYWPDYVRGWVLWNHVRSFSASGATICYMIAAITLAQGA